MHSPNCEHMGFVILVFFVFVFVFVLDLKSGVL